MTEKTDPQPLTDEEVEEWEKYYSDPETIKRACYECFPHREALARIRADGRRIDLLATTLLKVLIADGVVRDDAEPTAPEIIACAESYLEYMELGERRKTIDALEDKTK